MNRSTSAAAKLDVSHSTFCAGNAALIAIKSKASLIRTLAIHHRVELVMTHRRQSRRLITPRSYERMPTTRLHLLGGNSLNISRTLLKPIQMDTITGKPHKKDSI